MGFRNIFNMSIRKIINCKLRLNYTGDEVKNNNWQVHAGIGVRAHFI